MPGALAQRIEPSRRTVGVAVLAGANSPTELSEKQARFERPLKVPCRPTIRVAPQDGGAMEFEHGGGLLPARSLPSHHRDRDRCRAADHCDRNRPDLCLETHVSAAPPSYAVSPVFLQVRLILGLTGLDQPFNWAITETVVWSCLALAILVADLANQWHEIASARPRPVKVEARGMAFATPAE